MKYILVTALVSFLVQPISAGERENKSTALSYQQKQILKSAYNKAKEAGLPNPYILPCIIMQESKAGVANRFRSSAHKSKYDQTVGLGQIKTATAKDVLKRHPEVKATMKSPDVNQELAYNDNFNLTVACLYLKELSKHNRSDASLIAAYNLGEGGVKKLSDPNSLKYVSLVKQHYTVVRSAI